MTLDSQAPNVRKKVKVKRERPDLGMLKKGKMVGTPELDKLIKIEKGLLPFKGPLPDFLPDPIKAFKWKKFFIGEI